MYSLLRSLVHSHLQPIFESFHINFGLELINDITLLVHVINSRVSGHCSHAIHTMSCSNIFDFLFHGIAGER